MGIPARRARSLAHTSEQPHRRVAPPQLEASTQIAFIAARCVVKVGRLAAYREVLEMSEERVESRESIEQRQVKSRADSENPTIEL